MATPSRRYEASPTTYTARLSTAPTARRYEAAPTTYTARPSTVAPRASYQAAPAARTATPMAYSGQSTRSKSMKGLGQADTGTTSSRWKYAALGLAALAVAQFFWWDRRAPWVLRGKSY